MAVDLRVCECDKVYLGIYLKYFKLDVLLGWSLVLLTQIQLANQFRLAPIQSAFVNCLSIALQCILNM